MSFILARRFQVLSASYSPSVGDLSHFCTPSVSLVLEIPTVKSLKNQKCKLSVENRSSVPHPIQPTSRFVYMLQPLIL
jgi:hypothetical protein